MRTTYGLPLSHLRRRIISLALILSTLHSISRPPSTIEHTPMLTELSLSAFPFAEPSQMRHLLGMASHVDPQPPVPSLVDLCVHRLGTCPAPYRSEQFSHLPLPTSVDQKLKINRVPFYHPSTYNARL